jgi:glycosyltransferase involved in cell wall biosynthesis
VKIVFSFPHPSDTLAGERAGHVIRANSLLRALEELGHEVIRVEGARGQSAAAAVGTYRTFVRDVMPEGVAARVRDLGRIAHSRQFARRVERVVADCGPDVILETEVVFATAGARASRRFSVPLVLDDVSPAWEAETHYGLALTGSARRARRQALRQAELVVVVNELVRQELINEGTPPEKLALVPNGVDPAFFSAAAEGRARRGALGITEAEVVIGFVGSFQPFHGVDELVRSFARSGASDRARLLLVGDGDGLRECVETANRLGLTGQVLFVGRVPHQEVPSYVAASDITVLPKTAPYTNPMKLYEYLAAGKPSVAPRQVGIARILTDEHDAVLFDPADDRALACSLRRLVDDPALRLTLGRNASESGAAHTWRRRAATLMEAILTCT